MKFSASNVYNISFTSLLGIIAKSATCFCSIISFMRSRRNTRKHKPLTNYGLQYGGEIDKSRYMHEQVCIVMCDKLLSILLNCCICLYFNRVPAFIPEPHGYTKMEWCSECCQGRRDVSHVSWEDLNVYSIWLHSLRYTSTHRQHSWTFETPRPPWADFDS